MQIALVGIGKIALDQHVPALAASGDWQLAATVSRSGTVAGVEAWTDFDAMLENRPEIRVVSLALPPAPRFEYALKAIRAGRHVMLEKPPGTTLSECHLLATEARARRVSLFASWHSREAAMVDPACAFLADCEIRSAQITWLEDVREWHPGQDWVFEPGGMGVFDPGINALSILTKILPFAPRLTAAELATPENRQTPIAADLQFADQIEARFDWLHQGPPRWDIDIETDKGQLRLSEGGARMWINTEEVTTNPGAAALEGEYPRLYAQMSRLVQIGDVDMDLAPMRIVADAFALGARRTVAPFHF